MLNFNYYSLPEEWADRIRWHASNALFERELSALRCQYELASNRRISFLTRSGRKAWFNGSNSSLNTPFARESCRNKLSTKRLLNAADIATPPGKVFAFGERAQALRFAQELGYPVVIKPIAGSGGKGVYSNITSQCAFMDAWAAQPSDQKILVEKHVEGEDYRAYILDGRVLAVARREPPAVRGDGRRTLLELVQDLNRHRRESKNPIHKAIRLQGIVRAYIEHQGLSHDSLIERGRRVVLRPNANVSTGGTVIDVTDEAPEDITYLAVRAASAVKGLRVAGVDMLYREGLPGHIIEVNHNPMLSLHHFPWKGSERNIASILVNTMLSE